MITDYADLAQAVITFTASTAAKLRRQKSAATSLMLFIQTNRFRNDLSQYALNTFINLPVATNDTLELIKYAQEALQKIYQSGFQYKKAGIIALEIVPESQIQANLFDTMDRQKQARIMDSLDAINRKYKSTKIQIAAEGFGQKSWALRKEHLSPAYTTKFSDILTIKV